MTVIDGATHNTVDIPTIWQPALVAINTFTNKIYAAGSQAGGGVAVIDGATGSSTPIATPAGPWGFNSLSGIAVNEVTNKVYVLDSSSKNMLVIDGLTNELTVRALEFPPCSLAVDTASNRVYVSHCSDSRISIVSE